MRATSEKNCAELLSYYLITSSIKFRWKHIRLDKTREMRNARVNVTELRETGFAVLVLPITMYASILT